MKTNPEITDKFDYDSMVESLAGESRVYTKRGSILTRFVGEILCPGLPPGQQRLVARILLGAVAAGILTGTVAILVIRSELW